jgi:hypothetical protein
MSDHSEIVHDYIELRNFLATSHPQANVKFDIGFIVIEGRLFAFSSVSKCRVEIARIQPEFFYLYTPSYGLRFEKYSDNLIKSINDELEKELERDKDAYEQIIFLSHQHKRTLDLKMGYEPKY